MAYPSDLTRTKNWGTEVMTDADLEGQLDLIINWAMAAMDATTGHKHDGTQNEGPQIGVNGIAADAITFADIDDDGDFGLFTGDWSFNEIALVEDAAPATAAGEMKLYTKDTGGQPELFAREESSGDEIQMTQAGRVKGRIVQVVNTMLRTVLTVDTPMPIDDSKPQITEGDLVLTRAITPKNANNLLLFEIVVMGNPAATDKWGIALFKDAGANAIAAISGGITADFSLCVLPYYVVAGGVAEITFTVRAGRHGAGNLYVNGNSGGTQLFDGVCVASITITEIEA